MSRILGEFVVPTLDLVTSDTEVIVYTRNHRRYLLWQVLLHRHDTIRRDEIYPELVFHRRRNIRQRPELTSTVHMGNDWNREQIQESHEWYKEWNPPAQIDPWMLTDRIKENDRLWLVFQLSIHLSHHHGSGRMSDNYVWTTLSITGLYTVIYDMLERNVTNDMTTRMTVSINREELYGMFITDAGRKYGVVRVTVLGCKCRYKNYVYHV
jgi:hypothetical protein